MLLHRRVLFFTSLILVGGSLVASTGYALYLRTDAYRQSIADEVSDLLELPTDIRSVEILSSQSRRFTGIQVWLPGRRSQVFACDEALWRAEKSDLGPRCSLGLRNGWLLLGTGEFSREDYLHMLTSSLGIEFSDLNLGRIDLTGMDIIWRQPDFELRVADAAGEVLFDSDGVGHAVLTSRSLNGATVTEPIDIRASFTPGTGLAIHRVALEVPQIPLASLGIDPLLHATLTDGWFAGTLTYRVVEGRPTLALRGAIGDARLEELTQRVVGGPFRGRVDVRLDDALFSRAGLERLVFSGELSQVRLSEFAPLLGDADLEGRFDLRIHQARYENGRLQHFSASAAAVDVSMAALTGLLGKGVVTGQLRITVNSVLVVDDTLQWADIDLDVVPPPNQAGTIDREAIRFAANQVLGVDLESVLEYLPEHVEYAHLGCKLLVNRDGITVRGSHGEDHRTILSVRLFGREVGIIKQPAHPFPIAQVIEAVRSRATGYGADQVIQWLKKKHNEDDKDDK